MPLYRAPKFRVLGSSAVGVSGGADTNENILATITVPAGAMGLNGILRWDALFTHTSSANNKILRVRFGGIGGTTYLSLTNTTTATYRDFGALQNRGAANSQVGKSSNSTTSAFSATGTAVTTSAIDTSAATTLVITGQKASAGETLTLEQYLVELILP